MSYKKVIDDHKDDITNVAVNIGDQEVTTGAYLNFDDKFLYFGSVESDTDKTMNTP